MLRDSERRSPTAVVTTAEQRARYCTANAARASPCGKLRAGDSRDRNAFIYDEGHRAGVLLPILAVGRVIGVVEAMVATCDVYR